MSEQEKSQITELNQNEETTSLASNEDSLDNQNLDQGSTQEDVEATDTAVDMNQNIGNWYIIQTLSNYEKRVQTRIQNLIDEQKFTETLFRVLVPMQQTVELKNNKRLEKNTKIFPGYVFVQMDFNDELAYEIKQFHGVAKFIGIGSKPSPVVEDEILKVLRKVGDKTKEIDVDFEIGEIIKVIDGPFRGYSGTISEINAIKGKIKAKISIFGRETPVELDFEQVEKTV